MKRCIVIGSMPVETDLKSIISQEDIIYCADGGYLEVEKQGIIPHIIVGDFDSSPQPDITGVNIVKLPVIKDDTDTYYIARQIVKEGFTHAVFCGVTGGRPDHTFANIQMLKFLALNGVNAKIIDRNSTYTVVCNGEITIEAQKNCYFSVFSLDEKCLGVTEKGGFYEINDAEITNDFPIGVSNEFIGNPVTISVNKGSLLIITTKKD